MTDATSNFVTCVSPAGLHRMAYKEWGDRDNPRVLVCVHGVTRVGDDFDHLARALSGAGDYRVICPDVVAVAVPAACRTRSSTAYPSMSVIWSPCSRV